jgi:predicted lactoylglutathione lyase
MKRMHIHIGVDNLAASIKFYSTLFAAEPTVIKDDYAKWMLDDPRVNFAISSEHHATKGIEHLGIQAESPDELQQVFTRLRQADAPMLEEGQTTCCYARSEKSWISDPDGVVWEAFYTNGESVVYGEGPELSAISENAAKTSCCVPSTAALS